ncbi:MAG: hypothetical protein KDA80_17220 [Planctomycetaceae bacterium]|nr:hypothetical protein [Planctomycetaceae bacterium]
MSAAVALASFDACVEEEPQIYSFAAFANVRSRKVDIAPHQRAKLEHQNRCCPICRRATVEPVELRNGQIGRNGQMIPGTGTLVGFSCNGCGHEWPVD